MTKVYCADVSCKFCNDNGVCTQKKIALSFHSVMTVHEGRKEFHRCKTYEESKESIRIKKEMRRMMNNADKNGFDISP